MTSAKQFYYLTKPGIIRGNAFTATAGFFLATNGYVDLSLYAAMITGLSLIVACGCVLNNILDRAIDRKMKRTKGRALATGNISVRSAFLFAFVLGVAGSAILGSFTNFRTLAAALTGLFFYVVVYGFAKRRTVHGTLIGSISGAIPPVVGYLAVANRLDSAAWLLFLILACWQMPHFFAIAIYRIKDYAAAGIPVLPVKKGILNTKLNMLGYTVAFIVATLALGLSGHAGYVYSIVALVLGLAWLWLCILGFKARDDVLWARQIFRLSLVVITGICAVIVLDALLLLKP